MTCQRGMGGSTFREEFGYPPPLAPLIWTAPASCLELTAPHVREDAWRSYRETTSREVLWESFCVQALGFCQLLLKL